MLLQSCSGKQRIHAYAITGAERRGNIAIIPAASTTLNHEITREICRILANIFLADKILISVLICVRKQEYFVGWKIIFVIFLTIGFQICETYFWDKKYVSKIQAFSKQSWENGN